MGCKKSSVGLMFLTGITVSSAMQFLILFSALSVALATCASLLASLVLSSSNGAFVQFKYDSFIFVFNDTIAASVALRRARFRRSLLAGFLAHMAILAEYMLFNLARSCA
ncbi:hypothetical protein AADW59_00265 [Candidatus Hodgkinia cicadicola]